ncbi:MAG: M23 family metallopeptidase [Gemmatimonadetes bacterium]|nr:M23 family metallopeptidase [Gemmatimonadota bacterium]
MLRRKLVSFVHLPANARDEAREYGLLPVLAGLVVLVLLMLAGWHIGASYLTTLLDDGALTERERENNRLREQLSALHELDGTIESGIEDLSERAADIDKIVRGPGAPGPLGPPGSAAGAEASPPVQASIEWSESPAAAIDRIGGGIDRLLDETRAELASLRSVEAASRDDEAYWRGIPIISPVQGPVSRPFGTSRNLLSDEVRVHGGLDIAANKNEPVRATAYGVVSRTGVNANLGRYVDINHQNGYVTRYGHLSEVLVENRQRVNRGEVIGLVGMTGKTSGYHIHYEVHYEGRILDPSTWFFPERGL